MIDRRHVMLGASLAGLAGKALAQTPPPEAGLNNTIAGWPAPTETIDLWPGGIAPGLLNPDLAETAINDSPDPTVYHRSVKGISRPRLCVFPAPNPNGAAILLSPGGAYVRIVLDIEGYEMARFFNNRGFTAFVLFYRLPAEGWAHAADAPLADAQRAMRLIRMRAARYGIDPARVASMGFSAGGHVCASLATRFSAPVYAPVDDTDSLDARPFLCAPIYPVLSMDPKIAHMGSRLNLLGQTPSPEQLITYSPDHMVTSDTPPCFVTHAEDDATVQVANSLVFREALKDKGVPVETHLFPTGGHGFGLRKVAGTPTGHWAELFLNFARSQGLFNG